MIKNLIRGDFFVGMSDLLDDRVHVGWELFQDEVRDDVGRKIDPNFVKSCHCSLGVCDKTRDI